MKNLIASLIVLCCLSSCVDRETSVDKFNGVEGILYYQKPEFGSAVFAVFIPYSKDGLDLRTGNIDSSFYKNGIQFVIFNYVVKNKLYSHRYDEVTLKNMRETTANLLPNAKIYFHINSSLYNKENVMGKDIEVDTLFYKDRVLKFKYKYSFITIDSIIVD